MANLISAESPEIEVSSPLKDLPMPYDELRKLIVQVIADKNVDSLIVNGVNASPLGDNRFSFCLS